MESEQEVNNGSLLPGKKWTLKTEITQGSIAESSIGYCTDVAVYADGNIVVADTDGNRLLTISTEGQLFHVNQAKDLPGCVVDNPTGIAVSGDDQLWILDDNATVKTLNRVGKLLHRFTPFEESGGVPSCIAVGGDGQIAIGDEENDVIALYKPDGSLTETISASMIGDYLTIDSKQNLLYTNFSEKKLLSVNRHGDKVIAVDTVGEGGEPIFPSGVACDAHGDIYVSAQTNPGIDCGEVHHFDPEGRYKGRVLQGLANPFGMVFTPGGDLVVAEGVSVKIFHHE